MATRNKLQKFAEILQFRNVYENFDPRNPELVGEGGLPVERKGNWSFLAWEAPNSTLPFGRLWVSDDAGLRAYLP